MLTFLHFFSTLLLPQSCSRALCVCVVRESTRNISSAYFILINMLIDIVNEIFHPFCLWCSYYDTGICSSLQGLYSQLKMMHVNQWCLGHGSWAGLSDKNAVFVLTYNPLITIFKTASLAPHPPLPLLFLFNTCKPGQWVWKQRGSLNKTYESKCVSQHKHQGTKLMSQSPVGGVRTNWVNLSVQKELTSGKCVRAGYITMLKIE